ncbi:MAG: hypothetical protein FWG57_01485 [Endomicrobia bacterium]|nr:hypothetical protein [Endomicrobiia bacterium]
MGKSNTGNTSLNTILVVVFFVLLLVFAPKIIPFVKSKFGSKEGLKELATDIDKLNKKGVKQVKKAGDGMGKGIDMLRTR